MQNAVLKIKTAKGLPISPLLFGKKAIGSGSGKRSLKEFGFNPLELQGEKLVNLDLLGLCGVESLQDC